MLLLCTVPGEGRGIEEIFVLSRRFRSTGGRREERREEKKREKREKKGEGRRGTRQGLARQSAKLTPGESLSCPLPQQAKKPQYGGEKRG